MTLVEREDQLSFLGNLFADCRAGNGRVVLVTGPIATGKTELLHTFARQAVAVDDVHHADAPSLQCLSYLIRRLRSARVMVVLNETVRSQPVHSLFHAELPPEPQCHRIRLEPLSLAGTEAVLARHLDAVTARQLAPECHQLSGGNPLLLRGLVEDFRTAAKTEPATAVVGAATGQALLSCLYRCESTMLRL